MVMERLRPIDRTVIVRAALGYLVVAVIATVLVAVANSMPGVRNVYGRGLGSIVDDLGVVGGWCRFDCGWYIGIARDGYSYVPGQQSNVAFFPVYPLLARGVNGVINDVPLSLIIVSWISGFSAIVAFAAWCSGRLDRRIATWAVASLLLYPYGFYLLGAGYGDGLFLALVVCTFLLLERNQLVLASVFGALAGATRSIGIVVFISLVLVLIDRRGGMPARESGSGGLARIGIPAAISLRVLRARDSVLLIALLGPIGWSLFLDDRFGDGFAYVTVQEAWVQKQGPRTWLKVELFSQIFHGAPPDYWVGRLIQAFLILVLLSLLPLVAKKLGPGYAAYSAGVLLLAALGTKDFQSMGRYALAAFPVFALVGIELSSRRRLGVIVLIAGAVFLGAGAFGFGRGWYLS